MTLLELLQNFLKVFLELRLSLLNQIKFLFKTLPLLVVLLRELHPQSIQILFHLDRTTKISSTVELLSENRLTVENVN